MKNNFLGIPPFKTFEEVLSSSWAAVRVATLTVLLIAFQSKKVIETFSLYDGWVVWVHSILWTGVTAFAVLHFTVKLAKVGKTSIDKKKIRRQLGGLIILFSFVEFLLGVGYHMLWINEQAGITGFVIPDLTPTFAYLIFLDMILPATLYFYGHTIQIKTQTELNIFNPPQEEKEIFEVPKAPLEPGDRLIVELENFGDKELKIKGIKLKNFGFVGELRAGTEYPK